MRRAQAFASRYLWFLKCDIRKSFDSILHGRLLAKLESKIKDPFVLAWFEKLSGTYEKSPGRGLPIGNLTSQYFANLYLDGMDRLASPYVRYMDDFVFWGNDKDSLLSLRERVETCANVELGLELKEIPFVNRTRARMDFRGFRVFYDHVEFSWVSARRYITRVRGIAGHRSDERRAQMRLASMTAFAAQADSHAWRAAKLKDL